VHACTDTCFVEQINSNLLQDAGSNAAKYVFWGLRLKNYGVDTGFA
jgi:hypothetical protein